MPFWSGEKLVEQASSCILGNYDINNIDCAAYTLHVGPEVFVTPDHYEPNPSQTTKRSLEEKEAFNIPSGQFAFLITEELVSIPDRNIAFISMKASTKFKGLVNVSGFHVDPGYKGRLVFSVFNAGPIPIKLQRGMPLFLMWIADLDRQTKKQKNHAPINELDLKIITPIHGPVFSPQAITESIKSFKDDITNEVHKIDKKVSNLWVIAGILVTIFTAAAAYQIRGLMETVASLQQQNMELSNGISSSGIRMHESTKAIVPTRKSDPPNKQPSTL